MTTGIELIVQKRAERLFKDARQRNQFVYQVFSPPTRTLDGVLYRKTGSGVYYPFWRGFDGIEYRGLDNTPAGVAYKAGKYRKELEDKGLLVKLNARKVDPVTGTLVKE